MKKIIILTVCLIVSIIAAISFDENIFLTDSKNLIVIMLTIVGLCFSGFSFVSSSISTIIKKETQKNEQLILKSKKLINSIEQDILLIVYLTIVIIIVNLIFYVDIPLINNPMHIDFGLFKILSIKHFVFNLIFSFCFCMSFYAFYDLIKATFNLLKRCYE